MTTTHNQADEEEYIATRWESLHEYVRQMAKLKTKEKQNESA